MESKWAPFRLYKWQTRVANSGILKNDDCCDIIKQICNISLNKYSEHILKYTKKYYDIKVSYRAIELLWSDS